MKKYLVAILFLISGLTVMAQDRYSGVLRVQLTDSRQIVVGIDGRHYDRFGTSITISDLPAGKHYLKVYLYTPYEDGHGGRAHLIYEGAIHVYRDAGTSFVLNEQTGDVNISRVSYDNSQPADNNTPQGNTYQDNTYSDPTVSDTVMATTAPTAKSYPEAAYPPLTANDKDKLDVKVNKKVTDTDKLKLIEAALKKKSVTTAQVGSMMTWLMFEESKVELAKWAYSRATDKENYATLKNQLTYKSMQKDLDNYIKVQ